ncbi:MAG: hypothetical protein EP335_03725 [Alphaproteobacteria bacterium]|nr:MAG: hypothetical protein EP335_03725 [Alphaproteobacteria bacterium]
MKRFVTMLSLCAALAGLPLPAHAAEIPAIPTEHRRGAEQTYLTFPEWFLVHSPAEYAHFIKDRNASEFPYWGHIGQFWDSYGMVTRATKDKYPLNMGYHVMVSVIGTSTTVEYAAKSGYETMVGRLSEATRSHGMTAEDRLAADVAQDYVEFIRHTPWYKYDFLGKLKALWTDTGLTGPDMIRKWERKYALTTEYTVKAAYGWLIGKATAAGYEAPSLETYVVLDHAPDALPTSLTKLRIVETGADGTVLASLPRYQEFTDYAAALAGAGVGFRDIAGNRDRIVVSLITPEGWTASQTSHLMMAQPILTEPGTVRQVLDIGIDDLSPALRAWQADRVTVEHIYDF